MKTNSIQIQFEMDVFSSNSEGYSCVKIPSIYSTSNGTLLAFGEGRKDDCSDYTTTDIVWKRSVDGGRSWTALAVLVKAEVTPAWEYPRVGNVAIVEDVTTGIIFLAFNKQNIQQWMLSSADDGVTWSEPVRLSSCERSSWRWIGSGPPGAIQIPASGRLVIPAYHTTYGGTNGLLESHVHLCISDDHGETFTLGAVAEDDGFMDWSNECQAALVQSELVVHARGIGVDRLILRSTDDGNHFHQTHPAGNLWEPSFGCEGSTIAINNTHLLYSGVFPDVEGSPYRNHMMLWVSSDIGVSWSPLALIDAGPVGYSSLQKVSPTSYTLLYGRSNVSNLFFVPNHLTLVAFSL